MDNKKDAIFTLENGTKVVLSSANSAASYLGLFVASGSRYDGEFLGISHLIEHTVFKGTEKYSYLDLMNLVESVGGEMNAYTSKEETCFQIAIPNSSIEQAFLVLSEIFYNSIFPQDEIKKEKGVIVDEIESYEDVPNELIYDEFEELLFEGNSLATNILGTKKSLHKIQQKNIFETYKKLYRSDRIVVSYIGSENLIKVQDFVKKYFGKYTDSQRDAIQINPIVLRGTIFNIEKRKHTHQAHCVLGSYAPSLLDEKKYIVSLLTNALGGVSFNALLNMKLREERGLTYNIEANYNAYSDVGVFCVYFGTDYSKVSLCKKIIFDLFEEIIQNGFSEEQLVLYKKQMLGQISVSDDNYMNVMLNNAKTIWWFNHIDEMEELEAKINAISNDDIKMIASQILDPKKINVLLYKD